MDDTPSILEKREVDCWRAATSLARWCNALSPATIEILQKVRDDWSVPIPDDLRDMPALYIYETWRVMEQEHQIFRDMNYNARRLLDLSIQLRMDGIISEPETKLGDYEDEDCERAAHIITRWCAGGTLANNVEMPDLRRVKALRFRDTWNALERNHKVFRMHNNRTERLLNLSILYRMNGVLK